MTRSTELLAESLETLDGWKRINKKFMFLFGGGAKSFPRWQAATDKGVVENHVLRSFEHEEFRYWIHAFSTKGPLGEAKLQELKAAVADVDLGTVRYESSSYTCLSPWRGEMGSQAQEENTIAALSSPDDGLHIYPLSDDKATFPVVAYATVDGEMMIFPVAEKHAR